MGQLAECPKSINYVAQPAGRVTKHSIFLIDGPREGRGGCRVIGRQSALPLGERKVSIDRTGSDLESEAHLTQKVLPPPPLHSPLPLPYPLPAVVIVHPENAHKFGTFVTSDRRKKKR